MKPMLGIFTLALKFSCLFLGIFSSFYQFVTLIFDELVPSLNICFKNCFKSLFSPFQRKKTVSVELKMWYFLLFCVLVDQPMGGANPPPLPLSTLLLETVYVFIIDKGFPWKFHGKCLVGWDGTARIAFPMNDNECQNDNQLWTLLNFKVSNVNKVCRFVSLFACVVLSSTHYT